MVVLGGGQFLMSEVPLHPLDRPPCEDPHVLENLHERFDHDSRHRERQVGNPPDGGKKIPCHPAGQGESALTHIYHHLVRKSHHPGTLFGPDGAPGQRAAAGERHGDGGEKERRDRDHPDRAGLEPRKDRTHIRHDGREEAV